MKSTINLHSVIVLIKIVDYTYNIIIVRNHQSAMTVNHLNGLSC